VDWALAKSHVQWQALVLTSLTLVPLVSEIRVINRLCSWRQIGYRSVAECETVEKLLEINRDVFFFYFFILVQFIMIIFIIIGFVTHLASCRSYCRDAVRVRKTVTVIVSLYKNSHHASFLQLITRMRFSLSSRGAFQITAT